MELRVLKYFLAVAYEGNITRAAEMLHITQPTLSRQLMELEEQIGTTLFIRGKRHITLTEEGILFERRAKEITDLVEKTENEFGEKRELAGGVISIGCVENLASERLMGFIKEFSAKYSKVRFDLYNGYSDDIKEKMDRGIVDIGLLCEPIEISKYNFARIDLDEPWGVVVPCDDPLSEKERITLAEIADKPLIVPRRANIYNEIMNWFGYEDTNLSIVATYDLISNSLLLVTNGAGYAIGMSGPVAVQHNSRLKFIPITPERKTKSVIIWKKNHILNSASAKFLNGLRERLENDK